MLEVSEVSYKNIIKNISFSIPKNSILAILGPNGSGKTTLIKCILRFYNDFTGNVFFEKKAIRDLSRREISRIIAYIPQSFSIIHDVSAKDFLKISGYFVFDMNKNTDKTISDTLKKCGISYLENRSIVLLSGGEKQKLLLASALIQDAPLWICDEPTSALDPKSKSEFYSVLWDVMKKQEKTIVWITHDINRALSKSDYILGIKSGETAFFKKRDEVTKKDLEELYNISFREISVFSGKKVYLSEDMAS